MDAFNKEIDSHKNWVFKYSMTITIFVLFIVVYVINFIEVPVYDNILVEVTDKQNNYFGVIEGSPLNSYDIHDNIQVILEDDNIACFTIGSVKKSGLQLTSQNYFPELSQSVFKGKILVNRETLLSLILKSF